MAGKPTPAEIKRWLDAGRASQICAADSKQTGLPCRARVRAGHTVCKFHGGTRQTPPAILDEIAGTADLARAINSLAKEARVLRLRQERWAQLSAMVDAGQLAAWRLPPRP